MRDDARVDAALRDASAEIRAVLMSRYDEADFERLTEPSAEVLRAFAIDIALYRVALSFARSSERLQTNYDAIIKRLQAIADGKGKLSFTGDASGGAPLEPGLDGASNSHVKVESAERLFTRERMRGW